MFLSVFQKASTAFLNEIYLWQVSPVPPLTPHLKKECLFTYKTYTIKHQFKLNSPLVGMSESESSFCFLSLKFIVQ